MFGILSIEDSYVQDVKKWRLLCSTRGPICSLPKMVIPTSGGCYVRLISLKPLYSLGFWGVFLAYNSTYNRKKKGYIIISQNKDIRPLFFFGLNQQRNVMGVMWWDSY